MAGGLLWSVFGLKPIRTLLYKVLGITAHVFPEKALLETTQGLSKPHVTTEGGFVIFLQKKGNKRVALMLP